MKRLFTRRSMLQAETLCQLLFMAITALEALPLSSLHSSVINNEFSMADQNKPQPPGEMQPQRSAAIGDGLPALYQRQFEKGDVNTLPFLRAAVQHELLNKQKQSPAERLLEAIYQRNSPEMFQQRQWLEREVRPYGEENLDFYYTEPRTESMVDENEPIRSKKFVNIEANPPFLRNFGSQKRGNLLRLAHQAARGFGK